MQTIKKLPEYDIVEGAPKQLSELNKGIQDYLFQADILASADEIRELTSALNVRSKRKADNNLQEKWPVKKQGVIPYILDNTLSTFFIPNIWAALVSATTVQYGTVRGTPHSPNRPAPRKKFPVLPVLARPRRKIFKSRYY